MIKGRDACGDPWTAYIDEHSGAPVVTIDVSDGVRWAQHRQTPAQARALAKALLELADEIDGGER